MNSFSFLPQPAAVDGLLQRLQCSADCSEHPEVDRLLDAIESHPEVTQSVLSRARSAASHSLYRRNNFEEAARQACLALASDEMGLDPLSRAEGLVAWARIQWAIGDLAEALSLLTQARQLGVCNHRLLVYLYTLLGLVHVDLGQETQAEAFHRSALAAARDEGTLDLQIVSLTNLAGRLLKLGADCMAAGQDLAAQKAWNELDAIAAEADRLASAHHQELTLPHILVSHAASLVSR